MDTSNSSGSNEHRNAGHSTSHNEVQQRGEIKNNTTSEGHIDRQQTNPQPDQSQEQNQSDTNHENENKTTSNGNNGQQQTVPKSDRFQEQDLSDKIPEISEDEERRMKRINELDTLRGQLKALEEEKKKLQDELSRKEITILQLRDDIERRPERPKSAYPTDHRDKGRPERLKSAYPIDHRVQRETRRLEVENKYLKLILDDLHKSIIVGEAALQMELKPPEDIKNDKLLIEMTANAKKIHIKFNELETELAYINRTISQLTSMIVGDDISKDRTEEKTKQFTATGRQPKPNSERKIEQREQSSKIDKDIELVTSAWLNLKEKERECERHCNEMDALKGKLKHCEQIITSLKEEKLKNERTIIELRDENNELLNRLSKIASDRLTHENTDITDLSDDTRPSKLTEKMSELYDNQWTSAFDEMKTNRLEDEEAIGILLKIVMETNQVCKTMTLSHYQKLNEACTCFEYSSSSDAENKEKREIITKGDISIEMQQDIKRIWRGSSKKVLKKVIPIIREKVAEKFEMPLLQMKQTPQYMQDCAELCWMMNIQEKPMHLDISVPEKDGHKYFDTEKFRSYTKTGQHVAFVVWPALYLFERGSLLKKGVAQGFKG